MKNEQLKESLREIHDELVNGKIIYANQSLEHLMYEIDSEIMEEQRKKFKEKKNE